MGTVSTNEFRKKLKIMVDGQPYEIIENQFVKPGKGQAFNRVRIKNLVTGRTLERTWKSGDTVEHFFSFLYPEPNLHIKFLHPTFFHIELLNLKA